MIERCVRRAGLSAALMGAFAFSGLSHADDLGAVRLFDQDYLLHRFDYNAAFAFPDARGTGQFCRLWSVSGATVEPDTGALILTSNAQQFAPPYSYKNYVIEVRLETSPEGVPTGLSYQRTLIAGDQSTMGYDLDPRGVTINTSEMGLSSGGNLVIGTGNNWLRSFERATGEPIIVPPAADNGFQVSRPNTSTEDVAYVPGRNAFYTLWRSPAAACTIFNRFGRTGPAFFVGHGRSQYGYPSAITFLDVWPHYPRLFDFQPTVLIATDSAGPSIEAYDVDSRFIAREPVSSRLAPSSTVLPLHNPSTELWISALAADPATGRIMVFNRGTSAGTTDVFVLTPIPTPCPADFNLDGFVDFFDYDEFNYAFEIGDPRADFNHDGFMDFFDWDEYQTIFEVGC